MGQLWTVVGHIVASVRVCRRRQEEPGRSVGELAAREAAACVAQTLQRLSTHSRRLTQISRNRKYVRTLRTLGASRSKCAQNPEKRAHLLIQTFAHLELRTLAVICAPWTWLRAPSTGACRGRCTARTARPPAKPSRLHQLEIRFLAEVREVVGRQLIERAIGRKGEPAVDGSAVTPTVQVEQPLRFVAEGEPKHRRVTGVLQDPLAIRLGARSQRPAQFFEHAIELPRVAVADVNHQGVRLAVDDEMLNARQLADLRFEELHFARQDPRRFDFPYGDQGGLGVFVDFEAWRQLAVRHATGLSGTIVLRLAGLRETLQYVIALAAAIRVFEGHSFHPRLKL